MMNINEQITNKIRNLIHYEFYKQVDDRSYFELREKLRKQISNEAYMQVSNQLCNKVNFQLINMI
jgi:hypothetical protein